MDTRSGAQRGHGAIDSLPLSDKDDDGDPNLQSTAQVNSHIHYTKFLILHSLGFQTHVALVIRVWFL
jgi:hypothetical protein